MLKYILVPLSWDCWEGIAYKKWKTRRRNIEQDINTPRPFHLQHTNIFNLPVKHFSPNEALYGRLFQETLNISLHSWRDGQRCGQGGLEEGDEDGVEGDEQGDQVPWFLISFLSRSVTILNNDFKYCLVLGYTFQLFSENLLIRWGKWREIFTSDVIRSN